jgi:uncharacterized membrane protein HdeD (DUF308 family)
MNPDAPVGHVLQRQRYRLYLLGHGLIVVAVILLFRLMAEKKIAAVIAGTLFLVGPWLVLYFELRARKFLRSFSSWGACIFLLFSALPIFSLRILNWNEPFENLNLLGIPAEQLHKISNAIFLLMLAGFVVDSFLLNRKERAQSLQS